MRGLLVVGSGAHADAWGVAEATGLPVEPVHAAGGGDASALTAARHAGVTLDPAEIAHRAGRLDSVALWAEGGPLAPLTPRYAVRDLAAELGLLVLLAVAASADAVGQARLAAESVRAAGLRLAGVVLTGWPETPGRGRLDDRALLEELVDATVLVHPATEPWPVDEWLAAAAADPADLGGASSPRGGMRLDPYREWPARAVGDPRATPRPEIMAALLDIVAVEGPIRASRAYALYNRASGGRKLTTTARAPLASAMRWLAQERRVVLVDDDVIRLPDTPAVAVRELGPRTLEEVPIDEIAGLMARVGGADPKRAVLDAYGLRRLTTRADAYLELALARSRGS
jgi:hypothetical protein